MNIQDVFVILKNEAKSEEEIKVIDELIRMMICLTKHKNLSKMEIKD